MIETTEILTEYANTPMTKEMFNWVTERAWELKISRSAYIRSLIEREWAALQNAHTPSLQPTPNAGQVSAGNLRETCGESANG